jgi:hypothetical protein
MEADEEARLIKSATFNIDNPVAPDIIPFPAGTFPSPTRIHCPPRVLIHRPLGSAESSRNWLARGE